MKKGNRKQGSQPGNRRGRQWGSWSWVLGVLAGLSSCTEEGRWGTSLKNRCKWKPLSVVLARELPVRSPPSCMPTVQKLDHSRNLFAVVEFWWSCLCSIFAPESAPSQRYFLCYLRICVFIVWDYSLKTYVDLYDLKMIKIKLQGSSLLFQVRFISYIYM